MQPKILIVDDEPSIRNLLMRLFEKERLTAFAVSDSASAMEVLREHPINVIISDERMPGMTGSEFFRLVRQQYPDTIRILMTGYADFDSALRAINECEVFRFILKPWRNEELLATIMAGMDRLGEHDKQLAAVQQSQRKRTNDIEELEKKYPGIGKVERDSDGSIRL